MTRATGPEEPNYYSGNGSVSFAADTLPPPSVDLTLEDDVKYFGPDCLNDTQTSLQEKARSDINGIPVLNHTCNICDKKYRTEAALKWHKDFRHQQEMLTHQPKSSCRCNVCGKKFPDLLQFKLHSSSGHKLKCEDYKCTARFATELELRRHMRVEHDVVGPMSEMRLREAAQQKYSCTKCEKKYVLEADLKHHVALHHMKDQSRRVPAKNVSIESLRDTSLRVVSKNRIYVQGLPEENISMAEIAKVFSSVGPLKRQQHNAVYMYHRKPSFKFTGNCTVTYEVASDASKAVSVFNGKKMFEGGRVTVEMAMVPFSTQARDGESVLPQRGSIPKGQAFPRGPGGAHGKPSDPIHLLPPHLAALCQENQCDLCHVRFRLGNSQSHYLGRKHRERVEEVTGFAFKPHADLTDRRSRAFRPY